jgi:hypothetical protein
MEHPLSSNSARILLNFRYIENILDFSRTL